MRKTYFLVLTTLASIFGSDAAMADCGGAIYTPPVIYHHQTSPIWPQSCSPTLPYSHSGHAPLSVGSIINGERVVGVGPMMPGIPTTNYQVMEQTSGSSIEGSLNQIQSDLRAIKSRLQIQ